MSTDKLKVALFLPSLIGGGAERVMLNLACGFAQRGIPVEMVLAAAEGPYLSDVPPEVPIVDLAAGRIRSSIIPLASYLRQKQPEVLLSALDHANFAAVVARRLSGTATRVAISLHNTPSQKFIHTRSRRKYLSRYLSRYCHAHADLIIAVSAGVAADYSQVYRTPAEKIHVIYNPVISGETLGMSKHELTHPWFAEGEPPVILAIGRLTKQKDFMNLLLAFDTLRKEQRKCRLMILGEGELRASLETFIHDRGLQADVEMPGFVQNPYNYLARARMFVLSSGWEGLPTVLIEALAVGTPVISTNCKSGPEEILAGGMYGRLVPTGNPEALAMEMSAELKLPKSTPSEESWKQFRVGHAVNEYLSLFKEGIR